jgi:hypothetical protein
MSRCADFTPLDRQKPSHTCYFFGKPSMASISRARTRLTSRARARCTAFSFSHLQGSPTPALQVGQATECKSRLPNRFSEAMVFSLIAKPSQGKQDGIIFVLEFGARNRKYRPHRVRWPGHGSQDRGWKLVEMLPAPCLDRRIETNSADNRTALKETTAGEPKNHHHGSLSHLDTLSNIAY